VPNYEYKCTQCAKVFELWQNVGEAAPPCPDCAAEVKKVFHPPRVIFKGSGFYVTDLRAENDAKSKKPASAESKNAESKSESGEKSETKADKTETKTESKSETSVPAAASAPAATKSASQSTSAAPTSSAPASSAPTSGGN